MGHGVQVKSVGRLIVDEKKGCPSNQFIEEESNYLPTHSNCERYEMKDNIQGVEMSTLFFPLN